MRRDNRRLLWATVAASGGGGGGSALPMIAWDTDAISGVDGWFMSELPVGSSAAATGTWSDSDASVSKPIADIYLMFQGQRREVSNTSDLTLTSGTWDYSSSDFKLKDETKQITAFIEDHDGNVASNSAIFLFNHNSPLQSLINHPNPRSNISLENYWDYVSDLGTAIPTWFAYTPGFHAVEPTTGLGGAIVIGPESNGPVEQLIATTANGWAGRAVQPNWGIHVPDGVTLKIAVYENSGTPSQTLSFDGPIHFSGQPDEITVNAQPFNIEDGEYIRFKMWAEGSGFDFTDFTTWPVLQYINHKNLSQTSPPPISDPTGIFMDPVSGVDPVDVTDFQNRIGDPNNPFKTYFSWATDAYANVIPTGTAGSPINVYQPMGTVADGGGAGDACYLKRNVFHMQPTPNTYGAKPVIDGMATRPGSGAYGTAQDGLITVRDCDDTIVEGFTVRDSYSVGIVAEVQEATTGSSDNVTIRNCVSDRSGSDGFLVRGSQTNSPSFADYPITNVVVEDCSAYEANYAMQSPSDVGNKTGQCFTVVHATDVTVRRCQGIDYRKEGFDVISSRRVTVEDCFARRLTGTPYGTGRGAAFYSDAQAEGSEDITFRRCIAENDAIGALMGSEAGGACVRIKFESISITGCTSASIAVGSQVTGTPTYTDCEFSHISLITEGSQYAMISTTSGDPTNVTIKNCIFTGSRTDLLGKSSANWPTIDNNFIDSTSGPHSGYSGTNATLDQDPLFTSATDLSLQAGSPALAQITPAIRTKNVEDEFVSDPDNFGAY